MRSGLQIVLVSRRTISRIEVNRSRLEEGFTPDIYATDAALDLVVDGMSFRDAYRTVAGKLEGLSDRDPEESVRRRTHAGTAMHAGFSAARGRLDRAAATFVEHRDRIRRAKIDLFGEDRPIYLGLVAD
jgi:argininosuccinate lyase